MGHSLFVFRHFWHFPRLLVQCNCPFKLCAKLKLLNEISLPVPVPHLIMGSEFESHM
jgi:hypothetical protein